MVITKSELILAHKRTKLSNECLKLRQKLEVLFDVQERQVLKCVSGKAFSLHYTEISSVRCSMMKSIQAVSSLNPQSPRLAGHTQEMGEYFSSFQTKQV